jgi:FLVCR family MFS transporter
MHVKWWLQGKPTRFIVLINNLYMYMLRLQALVWNTWGPITESAEIVLDWQDSNIGMLANYGNIAFMITVLPMCYLVDVKGGYTSTP